MANLRKPNLSLGFGSAKVNALAMASGTLVSRLTGLLRLLALAYALGIGTFSDSFNLANNTPNIIYDLLLGGIISASILPVFVGHFAKDDEGSAWDSISSVFSIGLVLLVVGTAVFELAAPAIIHLYLIVNHTQIAAQQQRVATLLLRYFAPQLLFYGLIALLTAILNARSVFAPPAYAPVVNNIVAIFVFLMFSIAKKSLDLGSVHAFSVPILLLGVGTSAGVALQFLFLLPSLKKAGARIRFQPDYRNPAIHEIWAISGWTIGFVIANQVALFWILAIAASSTPGTVSAYTYGYIFFQLPYGIASYSIMAAIMPELARSFSQGQLERYKKRLGMALRSSVTIMFPAAFAYLAISRPVLTLLLGHGAVNPNGVGLTTRALNGFAVGLPGFAGYLAVVQAYQSIKRTRIVFVLYLLENGLNIILAVTLHLRYGTYGLAISLSIAYSVAFLAGLATLVRNQLAPNLSAMLRPWINSLAASVAMYAALRILISRIGIATGLHLLFEVILEVILGAIVFAVVTLIGTQIDSLTDRSH
ncbi:MAG: murein biosynthesis integral membrane protein MurJ [Actinomycetota bacterium]|nr:MAG: murein biosynthesis integral membrane protein MurJ [Actinomycetota bacterium]